jgi:hypothetical protein
MSPVKIFLPKLYNGVTVNLEKRWYSICFRAQTIFFFLNPHHTQMFIGLSLRNDS